jgi:hypothetical protein
MFNSIFLVFESPAFSSSGEEELRNKPKVAVAAADTLNFSPLIQDMMRGTYGQELNHWLNIEPETSGPLGDLVRIIDKYGAWQSCRNIHYRYSEISKLSSSLKQHSGQNYQAYEESCRNLFSLLGEAGLLQIYFNSNDVTSHLMELEDERASVCRGAQ